MNLGCKTELEIKASYTFAKPKTLENIKADYFCGRGNGVISLGNDNKTVIFNITLLLEFVSFADMAANFENFMFSELERYIRGIENWDIEYTVKKICGAEIYH